MGDRSRLCGSFSVAVRTSAEEEPKRERVLSDDELAAVWRATENRPKHKRGIVQLLILTGQRREEVADMRWSELDLAQKTWILGAERYKTKTAHLLPLTDIMLEIINEQDRLGNCDYVFTVNGRNSVDMSIEGGELKRVVGELPGGDWRLHDLRRTARSNWSKLGVPKEIRELLIHPKTGVEGTYDRHDFLSEKRAALEHWEAHVLRLVEGKVSHG
jgi:integrase